MNKLAYSLVRASTVCECAVRARGLGMAACLVCGAVRSRVVLSAAGCVVYDDITRACVWYGVRHMHRMAVGLMCGAMPTRGTYRGEVCGENL